jgi:hypothetical protein
MATDTVEPADVATDDRTLALLRNDLRGLTKTEIGELVAEMAQRMGVDPALAPIDLIPDRNGALRLYINARGASELAKQHDLSDVALEIDVREKVVIVQGVKTTPTGRIVRDVGASAYDPDRPDTIARAVKSATTSCHRRTTLRAVGIFLSEPETQTWSDA